MKNYVVVIEQSLIGGAEDRARYARGEREWHAAPERKTPDWDEKLRAVLPRVRSSSEIRGEATFPVLAPLTSGLLAGALFGVPGA